MAYVININGKTSCGKTTSVKTLNQEETVIFNVLNKPLPWKGSRNQYNAENKNLYFIKNYKELLEGLEHVSKRDNVKNIIVDDAIYFMRQDFEKALTTRGKGSDKFEMYNELAINFKNFMFKCFSLKQDLFVFLMFHTEDVTSNDNILSSKVATFGKLTDRVCNPEEIVTVQLLAKPKYDENGNPEYGFFTKKIKYNGIEMAAKSPDGMFDSSFIPNDLQFVKDKINEYYN